MNRRSFLSLASAAVSQSAAKSKVIVGAHPWVYAAPLPGYDITPVLDRIFEDMAWAGLDGVELMHQALRPADCVERIGDLSARHKLPVIGTSYEAPMYNRGQHPKILEEAEPLVTRLASLGGKTLGVSVGNAGHPKTPEELDAQAEFVKKLTAMCSARGIELNLHNHTYEVENGERDLKGTLSRVPDAKLGPDLDWLVGAKVDPVDFIRRYGKRIVFVHIRDRRRDGQWVEALGEGDIDYRAIGQALRKHAAVRRVIIELAHPKDFQPSRPLRESLKLSRAYVREAIGF